MKFSWKKYRIVKSDNRCLPWQIQERYFIKWWDTPSFAPPFLFKTKEEAFAYLVEILVGNVVEIEKGSEE